jgi:hypothetical protein
VEKSGDNIINNGIATTNINTTSAKGFERAISNISTFVIKSQNKFNKIVYGDIRKKYNTNKKVANTGDVNTALNNGLLYVVNEIASVDLCNISNYLLNKQNIAIGNSNFDPNIDQNTLSPIDRKTWKIKKIAYDVQTYIDDYKKDYTDSKNEESKIKLYVLISKINNSFNILLGPKDGLNDPELNKDFPGLPILTNYIKNSLGFFNRYTDVRQIPNEDFQKLIQYVDKLRGVCIAIQGLKSISSAINLLGVSNIDVNLREQVYKIQKLVPIDKINDLLKSVLNTASNINSIAKSILGYINTARALIRIAVLLIKVFKIIIKFLKALPIPNLYTTVGSILGISDNLQNKINKFVEKTTERLEQINAVLTLIIVFVTNIIIVIDEIIQKLLILKLNLENCSSPLLGDLNNTINDLVSTRKDLQTFLDVYNNNKNSANNKFGDYTISIVSEEIVDESIRLKRRYGIATNSKGYITVNTTPTFASLDLIIINEVKVLLVSKGLVDADLQTLSTQEIQTLTESLNYLQEGDINIQDINTDLQDTNFNDLNDELQIGAFVDKLDGGKKLRKRVRASMKRVSTTLNNTNGINIRI